MTGENQESVPVLKRQLRILCAEDDVFLAQTLSYALERSGHVVECAEDGQAAFDRVLSDLSYFDVLVTDHQMPRVSGLELVEKLRSVDFTGGIVVHSSALRDDIAGQYRLLEVNHILPKPAQLAKLIEVVEESVTRRE